MCNRTLHIKRPTYMHNYTKYPHYDPYYQPHIYFENGSWSYFSACTNVLLPIKDVADANDPFTFITADVSIAVKVTEGKGKKTKKKLQRRLQRDVAGAPPPTIKT
ncbi:hypothetical protein MtrunA17_Chr2g0328521 [Medicago truncatula]|nr:hypothetical protein MtrunA17_Chr2g0328521 [Medicago truncatula]